MAESIWKRDLKTAIWPVSTRRCRGDGLLPWPVGHVGIVDKLPIDAVHAAQFQIIVHGG